MCDGLKNSAQEGFIRSVFIYYIFLAMGLNKIGFASKM